jgi:hypothetical protein
MFDVEGLSRCKDENPLGLTNVQLEQRRAAVEEQLKRHPNISPQWVEWLWNYLRDYSEEELEEMVNAGKLAEKGKDKNVAQEQTRDDESS